MHTLSATAEPEKIHIVSNEVDGALPEIKVYGPEHYTLEHYFLPGVYIRQITMPAGHFIRGCSHRTEHFNIIQKGRVRILKDDGVIELVGPYTFPSGAGVAKALLVIEETVWSTVHLTHETDLLKLRKELIDESKSYNAQEIAAQFQRLLHENPRLDA